MVLCFDLDNVICRTKGVAYRDAKPITKTVNIINTAYDLKFKILIFTGRFYGKCNGDLNKILKMDSGLTKRQLKKWGIRYHKLMFGKPVFDVYVDDKAFGLKKNWHKAFKKKYL